MPYKDPAKQRECARVSIKKRRADNPELMRARARDWFRKHYADPVFRKQHNEKRRAYGKTHSEHLREYARSWYHKHAEEQGNKARENYRKHWLMVNGRWVGNLEKRARPPHCELCGLAKKHLDYHHWDNNRLSMGLWLCNQCHMFAEVTDRGLHGAYLHLKARIEDETMTSACQ